MSDPVYDAYLSLTQAQAKVNEIKDAIDNQSERYSQADLDDAKQVFHIAQAAYRKVIGMQPEEEEEN